MTVAAMTDIMAAMTNAATTNIRMRLIMRYLLFLATPGGLLPFLSTIEGAT
jgi:hypothetical protein